MSCEHTLLVQRLAVEDPAALNAQPWKGHLQHCPVCRAERHSLERSLAVFRQFESQAPAVPLSGPSWDSFSRALACSQRRRVLGMGLRVPLAAATVLAAVSTGVLLWPVLDAGRAGPQPARIVNLDPAQQQALRRVLHSSLGDPGVPTGSRTMHEAPLQADEAQARFTVRGLEAQVAAPVVARVVPAAAPAAPPPPEAAGAGAVASARSNGSQAAGLAAEEGAAAASRNGTVAARELPPTTEKPREPQRPQYVSPFGTAPEQRVVRQERERAPVLLFRSLQQRRTRRPPIQVLPAVSPVPAQSGSSMLRSLLTPRPIR